MGALLSGTAAAADPTCPSAPIPEIDVAVVVQEVSIDRSRTAAELAALGANAAPDWLRGRGRLLGLTEHRIGLDFDGLTAITAPAEGGICVGFRDGTLTLPVVARIRIASEIPVGGCLDREAIAHERKHHRLGLELIHDHARNLERRLAAELMERPLAFAGTADPVAAAFDRLRAIFEPERIRFDETYTREQLRLDTPSEYQRVLDACPGEQQRLLAP